MAASSGNSQSGEGSGNPSDAETIDPWRIGVVRHLAAAHAIVGAMELVRIGGHLAIQWPYTAGPLGLLSALTVLVARFLYTLAVPSPSDPTRSYGFYSGWIANCAGGNHDFLVAMVAVHAAFGLVNLAQGHGLWHRRWWARPAEIVTVGLAGLAAFAHGAACLVVGGDWSTPGWASVLVSLLVAGPSVAFMLSRRTRALFVNPHLQGTSSRGHRPWWLLSLQCLAAFLVLVQAAGLLLLFSLGPFAEIVWLCAGLSSVVWLF
jgi:hypothetical protein